MRICNRCREPFGSGAHCANCGVHKDRRVVKRYRRQRPIGGKRGRNSGTANKAKNKKGG